MTAHRALVHDCFDPKRYAQGNGALEVATLIGGLAGLVLGGLLTELALWAPFVLAAVGLPLLAWPTVWRLPVADPGEPERPQPWPLRFYATVMIRPGVRGLLAAETPLGHRLRPALPATLAALVPIAFAPGPRAAADLTRRLR